MKKQSISILTNTKEQVSSEVFLSDSVGGDYIGKVKKSGTIFFILKNSSADDINTITYHVDAPCDENFESVGDQVSVELKFE